MDIRNLALVIALHEEQMLNKILQLTDSYNEELERVRRRHKKILHRNRLRFLSLNTVFKRTRSIWMKNRCATFWEKDVPQRDDAFFKDFFRIERSTFKLLAAKLPGIKKQNTSFRKCIPLKKRIAIALSLLGSSLEYKAVENLFGISKAMISKILHEFCLEVCNTLGPEYLEQSFLHHCRVRKCVEGFCKLGFPQCFGAIGACHIPVRAQNAQDADIYLNADGTHSLILLAIVDHRSRFLCINIEQPGVMNFEQLYENSSLKTTIDTSEVFQDNAINLNGISVPLILAGNSAFQLSETIMTPYADATTSQQRKFNNMLQKSQKVAETAVLHLKARFKRLNAIIDNMPSRRDSFIMCCCILHNFCVSHKSGIDEKWLQDVEIRGLSQCLNESTTTKYLKAEKIRNAISNSLLSY